MATHSSPEYKRNWALKNKDRVRANNNKNSKKYEASEKGKEKRKYYYIKNRDKILSDGRTNKERSYELQKERRVLMRKLVLEHYGSICRCCGETEKTFLHLDHINHGIGNPAPKGQKGSKFYAWVVRNNFPDWLQILCANCNWSKGVYGKCIHEIRRELDMSY